MSGSRHDWLDEEAAERLLSGEPVNAGDPADAGDKGRDGTPTVRALSELLAAATRSTVEQDREDAALAAFRAAREQTAPAMRTAAVVGVPLPPEEPVTEATDNAVPFAPEAEPEFAPERRRRLRRLRGLSGSAKVAVAAAFAATALVGGVAAAAGTGVIPSPFSSGDTTPESTDGSQAPSLDGSAVPQTPDGAPSTVPDSPGATRGGAGTQSPSQSPDGSGAPGAAGGTNSSKPGDHGQGNWDQGSDDHDPDALCRAYLAAANGGGLQGNEWQWLSKDAGGQQAVDAYCRQRLGLGSGGDRQSHGGTNGSGNGGSNGNSNGNSNGGGDGGDGGDGNSGGRGNNRLVQMPPL
jgi:hypothetical protein